MDGKVRRHMITAEFGSSRGRQARSETKLCSNKCGVAARRLARADVSLLRGPVVSWQHRTPSRSERGFESLRVHSFLAEGLSLRDEWRVRWQGAALLKVT